MASINRVILVGNLGADAEVKESESGTLVTKVGLATTDKFKNKNGDYEERTEWHNLVFFGKLAEIAGKYLKRGDLLYVEGSIKTNSWQDKDGFERKFVNIVVNTMQMLGGKKDDTQVKHVIEPKEKTNHEDTARRYAKASGGKVSKHDPDTLKKFYEPEFDDDLPF